MAPSRRILPDQDAELRSRPKKRVAKLAVPVVLVSAGLLALVAFPRSAPPPAPPPSAPPCAAWIEIASDLKDTVPARILLGGPGESPELDERLVAAGIDRAAFRRAAMAVRGEAALDSEDATQDAMAASLRSLSLPESFEVPDRPAETRPDCGYSRETAGSLVLELNTRLASSPTSRNS